MRRAFGDTLLRLAEEDERAIFLTGDLGFGVFDKFIETFPNRYINVGVAEAQMVACAAGLAMEGWRPFVYSIASFMTGRAFEQIRIAIGYHNLPVVVVGAGGGYTYASSGVTHHAKEDIALMSLIPGMSLLVPGDPEEVTKLMPQLIASDRPSYIRIGRFGEPTFTSDSPIELGRGRLVRKGQAIALLTTGGIVINALEAADKLQSDGIFPTVCHFHTVRPFDDATFREALNDVDTVIVIEDHGIQGGLGMAVQLRLAGMDRRIEYLRLGPGDEMALGNPSQELLMQKYRYNAESIEQVCRDLSR